MTPTPPRARPRHRFLDRRSRNLCDQCDRWAGAPVHLDAEADTKRIAVDQAVQRFQRDMQKLVDRGDTGAITFRLNDGPEIVIARPKKRDPR